MLHRSDLTVAQREEYIKAVLCLQNKPAKAPKDQIPGAKSRYDDFVATHMTQAMMLHDPVRTVRGNDMRNLRLKCGFYRPTCSLVTDTSSGLTRQLFVTSVDTPATSP